jgi:hypothetical protein
MHNPVILMSNSGVLVRFPAHFPYDPDAARTHDLRIKSSLALSDNSVPHREGEDQATTNLADSTPKQIPTPVNLASLGRGAHK